MNTVKSTGNTGTHGTPSIYSRTLCIIGIILSSYALYVEHKTHGKDFEDGDGDGFQALCDIEAIGASCR